MSNCCRIRFDGQLILPYMTPEQLGMEDEDIIDVFITIYEYTIVVPGIK